jgi:hypothetical protein
MKTIIAHVIYAMYYAFCTTSYFNFIIRTYHHVQDILIAQRRLKISWYIDACKEYLVNNCPNNDTHIEESCKSCQQ